MGALLGCTLLLVVGSLPPVGQLKIEPRTGLEFVYVPAGRFRLGCEPQDRQCRKDEKPGRPVTVTAFWLGKTDVTVAAYAKCASAGACATSIQEREQVHTHIDGSVIKNTWCNWKNGREDHPANCVTWMEASKFCSWIGGRLPTGEEWEYAAKSGESRVYPWGDAPVTGKLANWCERSCKKANPEFEAFDDSADDGFGGTSPVGSYPSGASKWGLLDMAGNVFQWTGGDYDGRENRENCLPRAACKEIRGSGWITHPLNLRASFREGMDPANWFASLGFRCALN